MKSFDRFMKRIEALEERYGQTGVENVSRMSDEDLAARAREIVERMAAENEAIRGIVERAKADQPDRWLSESIRWMRQKGLIIFPENIPRGNIVFVETQPGEPVPALDQRVDAVKAAGKTPVVIDQEDRDL